MRLIDADKLFPDVMKVDGSMAISQGQLARAKTVEAFPKADYETRLKADMVAMLTEIQLDIEELRLDRPLMSRGYECFGFEDKTPTEIKQECSDIIQQKIDALRGETDE